MSDYQLHGPLAKDRQASAQARGGMVRITTSQATVTITHAQAFALYTAITAAMMDTDFGLNARSSVVSPGPEPVEVTLLAIAPTDRGPARIIVHIDKEGIRHNARQGDMPAEHAFKFADDLLTAITEAQHDASHTGLDELESILMIVWAQENSHEE